MFHPDEHIAEHADDFLHGLLAPSEADHVRKHTAECETCRTALEQAEKRRAALSLSPAHEPSEQLIQSTLKGIDTHERNRRRLRRRLFTTMGLTAAAAVLFLGGFHLYYLNLKPSPSDLRVYGQTHLLAGSPASLRVRLMNHHTGQPLAGVPVAISLRSQEGEPVELVSFTTDEYGSGQPRFDLPDWPADDYELSVTARTPGEPDRVTHMVRLRRPARVMLSSDKPVYQPGQTIQVRALGLRLPQLRPLAGKEALFTIRDPKDNVIFKQRLTSSKYGIAAIECPLATEVNEGPYTVVCALGDAETRLTVNVEKYVLPKFKITLKPDKPYYQPGDRARIDLDAQYVFGKPAAGATVEVEAKSVNDTGLEHKAKVTTDAEGKTQIDIPLPAFLGVSEADGVRIAVTARLTDTAGQKQTTSISSLVTSNPIRVEIIPEAGMLVQGIPNRIYFYASHVDGRPARTTLMVNELPQELRMNTNDFGVAVWEFTPTTEEVRVTVSARAAGRVTGWKEVVLTCGKPEETFLLRTDKAVYNGGDTMHLEVLGGGREPIFLDVLREGQTVLTTSIDLKDGRGSLDLDLPAEWFGVLKLSASRLRSDGRAVWQTRAFYIRQADQLRVQASLDRKEYPPGAQAHVTVNVMDKRGRPTPGAVSLAAVDESVFQIGTASTSPERQLLVPDKELQPVLELYPWSLHADEPVPPGPQRNQLEQALFARITAPPGTHSLHPLDRTSHADKTERTEVAKENGLAWVHSGWTLFLVGVVLAGYVSVWFIFPPRILGLLHAIGLLCFCLVSIAAFMTTGLGKDARPASKDKKDKGGKSEMKVQRIPPEEAPDAVHGSVVDGSRSMRRSDVSQMQGAFARGQDHFDLAQPEARLRQWFPETLLWRPQLITDDRGRCTLDFPLADSITTWRLSASAVTLDGRLGATREDLRVFQPFFVDLDLPVSLTRNDEITLRAVVHNHLAKPQTVRLSLKRESWFELLGNAEQTLKLGPKQVRSAGYRLKVKKAGKHHLEVSASAGRLADRLRKEIEVVSDGERVELVHNGTLRQPIDIPLTLPNDAIEGSPRAILKIYPSAFSQLVEGLDNIFQMPYGCFEQTSSTTYPNVLALDYLKRMHKSNAAVESKARRYIHLGYQRLLTFEVSGGGFDWYGRAPANVVLTAYGLMEFEDMARVHDVDPALIKRTRAWLLARRARDGSWRGEDHFRGSTYGTTAYVAWAVFRDADAHKEADATLSYLMSVKPEEIRDPYTLALACNALLTLDPRGKSAEPYLKRLESLKKGDGKLAWYAQGPDTQTLFYGGGPSANVETTALAVLALTAGGRSPELTRAALSWLVTQKDPRGTWHSTQATVLALKALLAGSGTGAGSDRERLLRITISDRLTRELKVSADQAEVVQQIDLTSYLRTGVQTLRLAEPSGTESVYQVTFRYHVPKATGPKGDLAVVMAYDRTEVAVGEAIKAKATVSNRGAKTVSMVMLELPVPAGFVLVGDDLDKLVNESKIDKFQRTPRGAVVYLRSAEPNKPLELPYRLRATSPAKVAVAGAHVYAYYDPHNEGRSAGLNMTVTEKK
jgi:uncharacterized protein YfaS (alpha-2-macroglobulin family)